MGLYHYDRRGHHLAQLGSEVERSTWDELVPSLRIMPGGALLWVLVGDVARAAAKYGDRAGRFLLLEAGHLMQSLCLSVSSLRSAKVPAPKPQFSPIIPTPSPLSSPRSKNNSLPFFRNACFSRRILLPLEGRLAIVTDVGSRMRWT